MNNNNQEKIQLPAANNESCCSKSTCCAPQTPIINSQPKMGRNDPCPCNSGRKFKKCCG